MTADEITKTVFNMLLSKSPGPDGFSVEFFKSSRSIVGSDVIAAVSEFFTNARVLKDINNTAIFLKSLKHVNLVASGRQAAAISFTRSYPR